MGTCPQNKKSPSTIVDFSLIYLPCIVTEDTVKRNLFVFKPEDNKAQ